MSEQDATKKQPSHLLRESVANGLVGSGAKVRGLVVESLVSKEIAERQAAILSLFEQIGSKEKELRKLESSGVASFDGSGNVVGVPVFTKEQVDSIRKLKEHIERMQNALNKAFESDDFSKVKEMAKGGEQQKS